MALRRLFSLGRRRRWHLIIADTASSHLPARRLVRLRGADVLAGKARRDDTVEPTITLAMVLVTLSQSAIAQPECSSIQKASDRLACYDKATPPAAAGKPTKSTSPQVNDGDALAQENDRLDAKIKNICRGC